MRKVFTLLLICILCLTGCSPEVVTSYQESLKEGYSATVSYQKDDIDITQTITYDGGNYSSDIVYGVGKHQLQYKEDGFFYYNDDNPSVANLVDNNLIYDRPQDFQSDIDSYLKEVNSSGVYNSDMLEIELINDSLNVNDGDLSIEVLVGGNNE